MIDKSKLHDKLIDAFIRYQYRLENPIPSTTETPAVMINHYRSDPYFYNEVNSLVAGVMTIVQENEDEQ